MSSEAKVGGQVNTVNVLGVRSETNIIIKMLAFVQSPKILKICEIYSILRSKNHHGFWELK
ncbi:hypothetical protein QR685DRAFT_503971 [Neurospora intermedia]|uniref:Uncharacterized protein n=1 Tax=Neurospora intermedia TaxID=5142 RepID=A0ABR3D4N3_NEUIN